MSSSGRKTQRRRHAARRHTHKQRGGAAWAPTFSTVPYSRRWNDWVNELRSDTELSGLAVLLREREVQSPTVTQKEKYLRAYFDCLAHQDKLFKVALNIIHKKIADKIRVDISTTDSIIKNSERIDNVSIGKGALMEYFKDVERMVAFSEDKVGDGDIPKLRTMYTDNTYNTLSTILLFPARVENVFIMALSEIICNLIEDRSVLEDAESDSLQTILATQYDSYAQALAHTMTAFPLRDGFYLNQSLEEVSQLSMREGIQALDDRLKAALETAKAGADVGSDESKKLLAEAEKAYSDFKRQDTFWKQFVQSAYEKKDRNEDELFKNEIEDSDMLTTIDECPDFIGNNTYASITADMLRYATLNRNGNIINIDILKKLTNTCSDLSNTKITYPSYKETLPDAKYFDTELFKDSNNKSIRFRDVLSVVDITTLEYLLHLEVAIKECWARRQAAKTP